MNSKPCKNCGSWGENVGCDVCGPPIREKANNPSSDLLDYEVVQSDHGEWEVWIGGYGMGAIIGMGSTAQEAKDDAINRARWLIENIDK